MASDTQKGTALALLASAQWGATGIWVALLRDLPTGTTLVFRFLTAALLLTVATVLGFGVDFYRTHSAVRVPAGPTIPAALHHDLEQQHERLDATFRTFRRLAPPAQPVTPPAEPDPKAMAPVRWI